jgi:hypothetical protein
LRVNATRLPLQRLPDGFLRGDFLLKPSTDHGGGKGGCR